MQRIAHDFLEEQTSTPSARVRFTLLLCFIASLAAVAMQGFGPAYSVFPFYAAVILSGWLCGRWATAIGVVISTLVVDFLFVPPINSLRIERHQLAYLAFFCGSLVLSAWFGDALRAKEAVVKQMNRDLHLEVQRQTAELQHKTNVLRAEVRERQEIEASLRKTQEEFDQMADSISDVFWILDPETMGVRYVNRAVEQLCEMKMSDFMSSPTNYVQIIHPEDRAWVLQELAGLGSKGEFDIEFRIVCPNGVLKWVEVRASVARDEKGGVRALVGIAGDITARKTIEAALLASEDRYRDLVEHSRDLICTHDLHGRLLSVNDPPARILGYSREELVNKPMRDVLAPEFREQFDSYIAAIKQFGFASGLMIVLTKSGERRTWEFNNTLRTEGVAAPIVRGVAHDVTERKAAERALRASEERFSKAFLCSPSSLAMATLSDGRFIAVNDSFERMMGFRQSEVIGRSSIELNLWVDPDQRTEIVAALDSGASVKSCELEFRRKDGERVWVMYSAETIVIDGEKCILAVAEDITQRKLLQDQLRQSQKMEALALVSSGVAHDFNNILTGILGFAELLLQKWPAHDRRRQQVQSIIASALQGRELTRQLLAYTYKQALSLQPVNLAEQINGMSAILRGSVSENIELQFELQPGSETVLADPSLIQQLLLNLVVNARDAMPGGGSLVIRTHVAAIDASQPAYQSGIPEGRFAILEVSDTGAGMDSATMQRIFEPYFTTKEQGAGTGLGLYRVYSLAKQCNGEIRVASELGRGTTFTAYFPVAVHKPQPVAANPIETDARAHPHKIILIVEDNANVRTMLHEQLESYGYTVISKERPLEALSCFPYLSEKVDLLLTDIVMPDLSGPELARRLREQQPSLKVLFITGYADDDLLPPETLGADAELLRKPFTTDELLASMDALLERRASAQSA